MDELLVLAAILAENCEVSGAEVGDIVETFNIVDPTSRTRIP